MNFHNLNHVYECVPPVLGISEAPEDEQVIIGLSVIPIKEKDEDIFSESKIRLEKSGEEAQREVSDLTYERIKAKVKYIKNLTVGEGDNKKVIDNFDDLYEFGPPEISAWVCRAVQSSVILTRAERKNSLPESDGH